MFIQSSGYFSFQISQKPKAFCSAQSCRRSTHLSAREKIILSPNVVVVELDVVVVVAVESLLSVPLNGITMSVFFSFDFCVDSH